MTNPLITKLKAGGVALGIWINSSDPLIAEIAVTYGAEWLLIDQEHEPLDRRHLVAILMACKGTECQPIVRIPENSDAWYKWVLDLGAAGVMVPKIKSLDDAKAAVQYAKYRPLGQRGVSPMRSARYGADPEYRWRANDDTILMLQMEEAEALAEVDSIVSLPGVDAIFIGPADLSDSLGISGQYTHPQFIAALHTITSAAKKVGMPLCAPGGSSETLKAYYDQGVHGFVVISDYRLIINGVTGALNSTRQVLDGKSGAPRS